MRINNYDEVLNEYRKAWGNRNEKMALYCANKVSNAVRLSNGMLCVFDKPSIETSFCFGYDTDYSGHEQSDAERARQAFVNSTEAFKNKNLRHYNEMLEKLDLIEDENSGSAMMAMICRTEFNCQTETLNLCELWFMTPSQYEWNYAREQRRLTRLEGEDLQTIREAVKEERAKFEKRLDTYLKRYGTSKLHTWTYWRD